MNHLKVDHIVNYMAVNSPVEPKQSPAARDAGDAEGAAGGVGFS